VLYDSITVIIDNFALYCVIKNAGIHICTAQEI